MTLQTTWAEKHDVPQDAEISPVAEGRRNVRAGQLMLFPNGGAVDAVIRTIPKGRAMTQMELRAALARKLGVEIARPVTSGTPIEEVAPVWRVLDAKAPTLKKISFDPAFILDQRAREAL
ncbi:MAG: hypothetical protein QOJ59_4145 [Thermomicrobiales bacterium]|jgi:hypothetical protein|nr:hypothetical protein [Thermomicrobiales bacterium]